MTTYKEHLAAFVRQYGDDSQRQRQAEGFLPHSEAEDLVRDKLFAPLDDEARFVPLTTGDLRHKDYTALPGYCCPKTASVVFRVVPASELAPEPWDQLTRLRELVAPLATATVTPRMHEVRCPDCNGRKRRLSALVEIEWHGRRFSRAYAL